MQDQYPPLLRDAGIRGTAILLLSVDETGRVHRASLERGTGDRRLDEIAQVVAWTIRFKPAEVNGSPAPVEVRIPLHLIPPTAVRAQRRRG
jgi:TonB family protein